MDYRTQREGSWTTGPRDRAPEIMDYRDRHRDRDPCIRDDRDRSPETGPLSGSARGRPGPSWMLRTQTLCLLSFRIFSK